MIIDKPKKQYIFVGPKVPNGKLANPGGQLTASIGLQEFSLENNFSLRIVDTYQESFPMPSLKKRLFKGLRRTFQVFNVLCTTKIEGAIVFSAHGISFYERILICLLLRIFRVKTIFFMRSGLFVNQVESSIFLKYSLRYLLKIPSAIGVQGRSWIPFYRRFDVLDNRIQVIHNWTSQIQITSSGKECSSTDTVVFCFVGWVVKEKGILELLEAALQLSKNQYNFYLHIVGSGTLEDYAKQYCVNNGLSCFVQFHGWCSHTKICEILGRSHVFTLPSHAEGFPNSMLEAMSLGLPVVCSDVGAVRDSLLDGINGFLVKPTDPDSLTEALARYCKQPELVLEHSLSSIKIVSTQHDRDTNCQKIFNLFHGI